MKLVDREYIENNKEEILSAIKAGKIFIYPTDTIYGLGCDATNAEAVRKIREIKHREVRPFSVIAPSKEWIIENCKLEIETLDKYLPGPYTLIANSGGGKVASEVNPIDETLGVRIPDHWLTPIIQESKVPFVTTSVNVTKEPHMEKLEDLKPEILERVDYVVYEGEKKGRPSERVNLL